MKLATPIAVLSLVALSQSSPGHIDPFAFFQPSVVVSTSDRERLERDQPVARIIPARGHAVAVFAAVPVAVDGARLEAWVHNIAAFKRAPQVRAIGRFSDPPAAEDLAGLTFPAPDIEELRQCRPGACGLKLTRAEIVRLQARVSAKASAAALQDALREIVLERVQTYLADGQPALGSYANRSKPLSPAEAFSTLLEDSSFLTTGVPEIATLVDGWPNGNGIRKNGVRSFVYWSLEDYGHKPIVSAMHVFIVHGQGNGMPETLVLGKQIFATHYIDAWLGVTALVRNPQDGRAYLVYLNRTSLDMLGGFWGGFVRRIVQRRVKAEAPPALDRIRRRLENGMPPTEKN